MSAARLVDGIRRQRTLKCLMKNYFRPIAAVDDLFSEPSNKLLPCQRFCWHSKIFVAVLLEFLPARRQKSKSALFLVLLKYSTIRKICAFVGRLSRQALCVWFSSCCVSAVRCVVACLGSAFNCSVQANLFSMQVFVIYSNSTKCQLPHSVSQT